MTLYKVVCSIYLQQQTGHWDRVFVLSMFKFPFCANFTSPDVIDLLDYFMNFATMGKIFSLVGSLPTPKVKIAVNVLSS